MSRTRLLIAAASAMLTFAAAAPGAHAITNGVLDGNDHPNVGMFAIEHDGIKSGACSGFYAGPRAGDPGAGVFVTAAHCLAGAEFDFPGLQASQLVVTFDGDAVYDPENGFHTTATSWHTGSAYAMSEVGDYGVIVLEDPVAGLDPVQFPTARLLDQLAAKGALKPTTLFDNVGYGLTSFWPNSATFPEGRMFSTSKFSGLRKTRLQLLANASAGYGGACFGDSGAPVLRHETNTVVAITSGGDALCVALNTPVRLDIPAARGFYGDYLQLP
jgi:Trypsin